MSEQKEELLKSFQYYCNACDTPFDTLTNELVCPFCNSNQISWTEEKISKEKDKIAKNTTIISKFIDILAKTLVAIIIDIVFFLKREKNSLYLIIFLILLSFLLKKVFMFNNFISVLFSLLFIIIRKR